MATYIEKHTIVTNDTLNVNHDSRETYQHVKFMNPDNIYYGTFTSNIYKFEDAVTKKQYNVVLSSGIAVISGDDGQTAVVNADQIKDTLTDKAVNAYGAIPSLKLISALNDNGNKRIDIVAAGLEDLSRKAVMLSGGNSISGENTIESLSASIFNALSISAAALSVPTFNDIVADGTSLSSILSSSAAGVSALAEELRAADAALDRKIDSTATAIKQEVGAVSAALADSIDDVEDTLRQELGNAVDELNDTISTIKNELDGRIDETNGLVNAISTDLEDNYYDKTEVDGISSTLSSGLLGAKTDTSADNTIFGAKKYAEDYTDKQLEDYYTQSEVNAISNEISTQASIDISNTKSELTGDESSVSSDNTIYGSKRYADQKAAEAESNAIAYVDETLSDYYTAEQTDERIKTLATDYLTDAEGRPFATVEQLVEATQTSALYRGSNLQTPYAPTIDDYTVVLSAENYQISGVWRYTYQSDNEWDPAGWHPQYVIENINYAALANKPLINGHTLSSGEYNEATGASYGLVDKDLSAIAIGAGASADSTKVMPVAVGCNAQATSHGAVAIGGQRNSGPQTNTTATSKGATALGAGAHVTADEAAQIGIGTNSTVSSLQFHDTVIVNSDGKIPLSSLDGTAVLSSRTINGKALSSDVTLYGTDILLSSGSSVDVANAIESKYTKPETGIPGSDIASNTISASQILKTDVFSETSDGKLSVINATNTNAGIIMYTNSANSYSSIVAATPKYTKSALSIALTNTKVNGQQLSVYTDRYVTALSANVTLSAEDVGANRVFIKDPGEQEYEEGKQSDLSVIKLTNAAYEQLVVDDQTQPNSLYVISDDYIDAYGQQIRNLSAGTNLSDAVNLEQLCALAESIPLEDYYTKSETSSADELSEEFSKYALSNTVVLSSRTINGKALSSDIMLYGTDIKLSAESEETVSDAIESKYTKPETGIPGSDIALNTISASQILLTDDFGGTTDGKLSAARASTTSYGMTRYASAYNTTAGNLATTPGWVKTVLSGSLARTTINGKALSAIIGTSYISASMTLSAEDVSAVSIEDGIALSSELSTKSSVSVDNMLADVNILHISHSDYAQKLVDDTVLSNELYVVSSDYIDAYGQQIKNLSAGTNLSDAVNLGQLCAAVDAVPLSDYYTKSETSSSNEIADSLSSKLDKTGGEIIGRLSITGQNAALAVGTEINSVILSPTQLALVRPGTSGSSYNMYRIALQEISGTFALLQNIASDFDATRTTSNKYEQYSLTIYNNALYKCSAENGHYGAWNSANWTEATVEDILSVLRTAIIGKYTKPSSGIPKSDLTLSVQASLDKADAALPAAGIEDAYEDEIVVCDGDGGVKRVGMTYTDFIGRKNDVTYGHFAMFNNNGDIEDAGCDQSTFANANELRYALGVAIRASTTLEDRTVNYVVPAADNIADIVLAFPGVIDDYARDFKIDIVNTSGNTGAITINAPQNARILGDSLTQTIAAGEEWLFDITELPPGNKFFVKAQKITTT